MRWFRDRLQVLPLRISGFLATLDRSSAVALVAYSDFEYPNGYANPFWVLFSYIELPPQTIAAESAVHKAMNRCTQKAVSWW